MPDGWRASPLPSNWKTIRRLVLERDGHQCTWTENGQRCTETTRLECDHIGDRDNHDLGNLRTLCAWHHARRTGHQAWAANPERLRKREARPHPGLIT